jgi:hypothetical protein
MQVYLIETANWGDAPTIAATREAAQRYLSARGYTPRQPASDLDPAIECWWGDGDLRRIIPVDILE